MGLNVKICKNNNCKNIFTPSANTRENFGKYCSRDCSKACVPQDFQGVRTKERTKQGVRFLNDWRRSVRPGTKVYLDQNPSIIFEIVHAERDIAWIKVHHVKPNHEHLSNLRTCWCEGEKLVTLSRCDMANSDPNWESR